MIDVVLPALDEEAGLARILPAMPAGYRPIVVDNGSVDATAAVARAHGALVIHERGAVSVPRAGPVWRQLPRRWSPSATPTGASIRAKLPRACTPVAEGRASLVLGRRQAVRGAWPAHARAANHALAWYVRRRVGGSLRDIGPMRAGREALLSLGLTDRRSGWPLEMVLRAARAGWVLEEVPVSYWPRLGRSKVTGTLGGTLIAVRDMSRILRQAEA